MAVVGSTLSQMSLLAQFDEFCRFSSILMEGNEAEYIRILKAAKKGLSRSQSSKTNLLKEQKETARLQQELKTLKTQMQHSRNLLDSELKRRIQAENDRNSYERQLGLIRDVLLGDRNNGIDEETREKLAFLNNSSIIKRNKLETIEETGGSLNFGSEISFDRTEDDLEGPVASRTRRSHCKRSLKSSDGPLKKVCAKEIEGHLKEGGSLITTTKVTNCGGDIVATAKIETTVATPTSSESEEGYHSPAPPPHQTCHNTEVKMPFDTPHTIYSTPRKTQSAKEIQQELPPPPFPRTTSARTPLAQHQRQHHFVIKTVIRPEACTPCGRKIKFYKQALRCADCRTTCHPECREKVALPCVPLALTPGPATPAARNLAAMASPHPPMIPSLVVHCVRELDSRGMSEVGLYRVSGADRDVKDIKEKFLRGRGTPNLSKVDVHVLCGVLKDFLRGLDDPLLTRALWQDFVDAAEIPSTEESLAAVREAVEQLPQPNRDTLAFVILHLQRVSASTMCKMPVSNLAKVFGPTIVGYSQPEPATADIMAETHKQYMVVERLLQLPKEYWSQFVVASPSQENISTPRSTAPLRRRRSNPRAKPRVMAVKTVPRTNRTRRFFDSPNLH